MSVEQQHSVLGASNAHRWMACPGSVRLSQDIEDVPSKYAEEGTLAHSVAEARITADVDAYMPTIKMSEDTSARGRSNTRVSKWTQTIVPSGMNEALDLYVQLVRNLAAACDWHAVEQQFNLAVLEPPVDSYGTSDFVGYIAAEKTLIIADLKFGSGLLVEVEGNAQLMYYALGAVITFEQQAIERGEDPPEIDQVRMVIVQPRAEHPDGKIRSATMTHDQLSDFGVELLEAMWKTQEPDAPLVTGPQCRFCRAAAVCPKLLRLNEEIAQKEFADFPVSPEDALQPTALNNEQIGHMLERLDSIEHWVASVRLHAVSELERGRKVPGWKLVAKRATRQWDSEQAVHQWLTEQKVPLSEHYTRKIKSPRQVEITLGEYGIGKKSVPKNLIVSKSSGTKLARMSSPEPEVTGGSEFFDEE